MATSGSTGFDLTIDELIEEAYERCGLELRMGYDLDTARIFKKYDGRLG